MATRVTFLCAGATASGRAGAFPAPGEPLDAGGLRKARALRLRGPSPGLVLCSPAQAAIGTAEAIGLAATIEPRVADLDFGAWAGRALADVATASPDLLRAWVDDPARATPGGEAMASLVARMATLVESLAGHDAPVLIVTHAAPMRAAIAHCLDVPLPAATRFDFAPLSRLVLSHNRHWRLQEVRPPGQSTPGGRVPMPK